MNHNIFLSFAFIVLAIALIGCSTPYQSSGIMGGYEQTRLGQNIFQVRFQGNGYSSHGRTSQFMLRRCAELTLEHGKQYFTLGISQQLSDIGSVHGNAFSFPSGQTTITLLDSLEDPRTNLDASIIITETNLIARGRLSSKASETLNAIRNQQAAQASSETPPVPESQYGYATFYTNSPSVKKKPITWIVNGKKIGVMNHHFPASQSPRHSDDPHVVSVELPIGIHRVQTETEGPWQIQTEIEVKPNEDKIYRLSKIGSTRVLHTHKTIRRKSNP
ncbi:MAG: hypothetical protein AAF587_41960 [Bacteroidota bacterium]